MKTQSLSIVKNLKIFLLIVSLLILVGFIFIYSASSVFALEKYNLASYFVRKQLMGFVLGVCILIFLSLFPLRIIKKLAPLFFFGSLILTALTIVPGLAVKINGSARWLSLGGFSFQVSELLKLSLILYIAYLLDVKHARSSFWRGYFPIIFILGLFQITFAN